MEEQLVVLVDPWQDKYDRLLEANEKLQKLNQTLEEKLLKLAEKHHAETSGLSEQIQDLTQRLVDARLYIHQLADENDRYRNDINVVIQLLQCKPSNFISPKIETLPDDLQRKILGIKNGIGSSGTRKEKKIIKVQVPTFPPTDIMYAVDKGKGKKNGDKDIVSAAIMAKVLQERENERKENRRNNCHCRYRVALPTVEKGSQTLPSCTISYSEFEFCNSEPEDEAGAEDDEEDEKSMANHEHRGDRGSAPLRPHSLRTSAISPTHRHSNAAVSQIYQGPPIPARRPNTWTMPGGRLPGGAVPVRTTLTTTFDEIIKTTMEEEARLPTPLFGGHLRHRNQSSTSQQHNQHYDNQQYPEHHHHLHHTQSLSSASSAMSSSGSEPYNNHMSHHHPHHPHYHGGGDTPPPSSSLQRSSSSSLSSPSSGLPPPLISIPTSAPITTDLNNGDVMMLMSSTIGGSNCRKGPRLSTSHISNVCENGSITTISSAAGNSMLTRSTSWSREKAEGMGRANSGLHGSSTSIESSTSSSAAGGQIGLMTSLGNHWRSTVLVHNPPKSHSSYEPLSLISVQGDGAGGQQTTFSAAVSPKVVDGMSCNPNNSSAATPLGTIDSGTAGESGGFNAAASSHSNNESIVDCNSDSEQPLLQQHTSHHHHNHHHQSQYNSSSSNNGSQPSTYIFNTYHNSLKSSTGTTGTSGGNGLFGTTNNAGYTAASTASNNVISSNASQYYRAQKRTFWARSSSTTSTETEI